jgi:hypothetical protein
MHPVYTGTIDRKVKTHEKCDDCGDVKVTAVKKWTALPLYDYAELYDDMDLIAGSNKEGKAWRLPLARILAGGDLNKLQISMPKGLLDIVVPASQVVPIRIDGNGALQKAQANSTTTLAWALAVGNDPNNDEAVIIQTDGFVVFPRVHQYDVGKIYYLSATNPGEVVTPAPAIAQPLFRVWDHNRIQILEA